MTIGEIFLETKFAVFNTMEKKRWSLQKTIDFEKEAFGFFLQRNPLNVFGELLENKKIYTLEDLIKKVDDYGQGTMKCAAILENLKKKKTSKGTSYAFLSLMDGKSNLEMTAFSKVLSEKYDVLIENELIIFSISGHKQEEKYRFSLKDAQSIHEFLEENCYTLIFKIRPQDNLTFIIDLLKKENQTSKKKNISIVFKSFYREFHLPYFVRYSKNFLEELDNLGVDYSYGLNH
jgi:DNA polymerase-3 subunit alpha